MAVKGKHLFGQGLEDFAEEMGCVGEKIERKFSGKNKTGKIVSCTYSNEDCGIGCFLTKAIFGLIIAILGASFCGWIGYATGINFFSRLSIFVFVHLDILFIAGVFFSFLELVSRRFQKIYGYLKPIETGARGVFAFWLAASMVRIINEGVGNAGLQWLVVLVEQNLIVVFALFALIGLAELAERKTKKKKTKINAN